MIRSRPFTAVAAAAALLALALAAFAFATRADVQGAQSAAKKVKVYSTVFKQLGFDDGFFGRVRAKGKADQAGFECRSRDLAVRKITGKGKNKVKTTVAEKSSAASGSFFIKKQNQVQSKPPFGPGRYQIVARTSKGKFNKVSYRCKKGKSEILRVKNSD